MNQEITFPPGAEDYYKVDLARKFLESPVKEGCRRWRCVLCGFPQGDFPKDNDSIGAYCCGGCGQSCVRPIEEYEPKHKNGKSIIEIAVDIDETKLRELESFLQLNWIGYYIEPPRKNPWNSLEEVEADCEGK